MVKVGGSFNLVDTPENRPFAPKGNVLVFQPSIFRCNVRFRDGASSFHADHSVPSSSLTDLQMRLKNTGTHS